MVALGAALGKARHSDGRGGAKVKAKAKSAGKITERRARGRVCRKGSGGDDGVVGTWAACSLGAVAKAAEAWRGWRKAK